MKKPEKRKLIKGSIYLQYDKGYNHSYDDWEKFLPSEDEIYTIITKLCLGLTNYNRKQIAKAISNRLSK